MSEKRDDYEIGHGKPPQSRQFIKGRSGNPKGRPKGAKSFAKVMEQELDSHVVVTENGQRKKIRKREVVAKQLVNKGTAGDPKFTPLLLNEIHRTEAVQESSKDLQQIFTEEDLQVLRHLKERLKFFKVERSDG